MTYIDHVAYGRNSTSVEEVVKEINEASQNLYNILVPVFAAWVTAVVAFYFGSKQAEKAAENLQESQKIMGGGRFAAGLDTKIEELYRYDSDIKDFLTVNFNQKLTSEFYDKINNYGVALVKFVIPEYYTRHYDQAKDLLARLDEKIKDEQGKSGGKTKAEVREEFFGKSENKDQVFRLLNTDEFDSLSWVEKYELIEVPDSDWYKEDEIKAKLDELSSTKKQKLFGVDISIIDKWEEDEVLVEKFKALDDKEKKDEVFDSPKMKDLEDLKENGPKEKKEIERKIESYYEKIEEKLKDLSKKMDENLPNWAGKGESVGQEYYDKFIGKDLGVLYVRDLGDLDNYKAYEENERTLAELIVNEEVIDSITERRWRLDPEKRVTNFAEIYLEDTFAEAKSKLDISDNSDEARGLILDEKDQVLGILSNFTILNYI